MFIDDLPFCEDFFCKLCQNSSLLFILPTSTHKSTPCQRISFFLRAKMTDLFRKYQKYVVKMHIHDANDDMHGIFELLSFL